MLLSEYLKFIGYPITFAEELERAFIKTKNMNYMKARQRWTTKTKPVREGSQERDPNLN